MKSKRRFLKLGTVGILTILLILLLISRFTLGRGKNYPDLSTEPLYSENALEIAATMDMPLGNPAVSADGRLFLNLHPLAQPQGAKVFEWVNGKAVPFPDEAFQSNFKNALGMFIDRQNRLWILDYAATSATNTRLLAFDLDTNEVVYDHTFGEEGTNLNDLQVSPDGNTVYFSAPGLLFLRTPAIVVHDIQSGETRRLLEGHHSVLPENWIVKSDNKPLWMVPGLILFRLGVDGIALSKDGEWLYYGGITNDGLYGVRTNDLLNENLSTDELSNRVEYIGQKPLSDGFSADLEGNIYITDVEHHGIARMSPDGILQTLVHDERVRWADGISFGPENYIYFTDSDIPSILGSLIPWSGLNLVENGPYHIFRFQSDKPGIAGG